MIERLEMFIALAKERHFGRAAISLGITQPSLSAGIKRLESELGAKLVHRGSRFAGLTPEGQRTLTWAHQITGDARRLRDEMRAGRTGLSGDLRIAAIPTTLNWVARVTRVFGTRHPHVKFTVLSRTSIEILSMLDNLEVDIGFSYLDNEPLGRMMRAPMHREYYTLICAKNHPIAKRREINWNELEGQDLCLLTPDMQNRRIINQNLKNAGVMPNVRVMSNSNIALVSHVVGSQLVCIMPNDIAAFLAKGHPLATIPINQKNRGVSVGFIAPYHNPQPPIIDAFFRAAKTLAMPHDPKPGDQNDRQ